MYEVYIYEKRCEEYIMNPNGDPFIATSDAGLLDLISTFLWMETKRSEGLLRNIWAMTSASPFILSLNLAGLL